ncbi:MAG: class I SAM-dependent methyltransferase [Clostridia bacterium]|nr:class I SAM-dependent methyltransferase [Clostridia bacterium]
MAILFNVDIHDFYNSIDEDARLKRSNANRIEFLTTTRYIENLIQTNSTILDACAGTGAYAVYLAQKGHVVTAGDLVVRNVEIMRNHMLQSDLDCETYVGSILDLSRFEDESFDVVLNLGSLYHLRSDEERKKSIKECLRVLKPNGFLFTAYINKYANLLKYKESIKGNFDAIEFYLTHGFNEDNNVFYATTPEDVEILMKDFLVTPIHHVATDGMKFVLKETINDFTPEEFMRWLDIHYAMCEKPELLGYSEHGLHIAKKL